MKWKEIDNNVELTIYTDFMNSNNLHDIEKGVKDTINGMVFSKKIICIALAKIKIKELYKQAHISTFKEYLKTNRVPIKYSTAIDYSIIGEAFLKYHDILETINFKEEDGLKKLLFLDKALVKYNKRTDIVFSKIKESSFRGFKQFVNGNSHSPYNKHHYSHPFASNLAIKVDEECIYVEPYGKEILWFNMDIGKELGIKNGVVTEIRRKVYQVVKELLIT
jgi:hypothetical protein